MHISEPQFPPSSGAVAAQNLLRSDLTQECFKPYQLHWGRSPQMKPTDKGIYAHFPRNVHAVANGVFQSTVAASGENDQPAR